MNNYYIKYVVCFRKYIALFIFLICNHYLHAQCQVAYLGAVENPDSETVEPLVAEILFWEARGFGSPEFMKAHAVAIRSYIYYNRSQGKNDAFQMSYRGLVNENSLNQIDRTAFQLIKDAVRGTHGIIMTYSGSPIRAFFFAQCNGIETLDADNGIWSNCLPGAAGGDFPYAKSRPCNTPHGASTNSQACNGYYGPGVGLCQRGGFEHAEMNGMSWCNILTTYYTDISINAITPPIPVFVDFIDLSPTCDNIAVNQTNNNLTISNVKIYNYGGAGAYDFNMYFILKGATENYFLGAPYLVSAVEAESDITVPALNFDIQSIPQGSYTVEVRLEIVENEFDISNNYCLSPISVNISNTNNGCTPAWNLSEVNIGGIYEAQYTITSTATISSNLTEVIFKAGNYISLEPGFLANANNGYYFQAEIASCDDAGNKVETEQDPIALHNYPNPFTGQTTIEFVLPQDSPVTLFVSDMTGRKIAMLLDNETKTQDTYQLTFDGSNYPAGMYYYTIQAGEYTGTQKMILVK